MAGVPMGYRATLYDLANKRQLEVYLEGDAFRTDRQIGGGPMPPGEGGGGNGDHIWGGGNEPFPTPPIALPPGYGQGRPPHIWGGGNVPMPNPPIYIPPVLPPNPGNPPTEGKPPPETGGWGYVPDPAYGWGYFPAQADKPHPPNAPLPGQPPAKP